MPQSQPEGSALPSEPPSTDEFAATTTTSVTSTTTATVVAPRSAEATDEEQVPAQMDEETLSAQVLSDQGWHPLTDAQLESMSASPVPVSDVAEPGTVGAADPQAGTIAGAGGPTPDPGRTPRSGGPTSGASADHGEASRGGGDPAAAQAAAEVAAEAAVTAQAMVDIASLAATNVIAKATHTAEAAVTVAAEAAADIVADAGEVAEAMVIAASAAASAAERVRRTVAGAISAEAAAKLAMAQSAERLSDELHRRKETEARLLAQEAELTAFAGIVAHDLKAPLRAVGGFTKMLRRDLTNAPAEGLNSSHFNRIDQIVAAVERMTTLIDDLLAFVTARDRALRPQKVDLQALVEDIISDHAGRPNEEGAVDEPPTIVIAPLPSVKADPMMCRQLLENLIGNALKYTVPGQRAYIQITSRPDTDGMTRIEIVDHGVGVPEGEHELVFTALHRSHPAYPGTGLGLAICQRIVDRHGGVIGVSDNPGGGSHFHFTLPQATT